ncbi:hypothetical protein CEUSTIGMA_g7456.t1 [Chlamydomonas eustigma]|uniref:PhoD-like phosphatase metallophosphatase domain-containing protein n=1 Tax=Chlamydomonas eustigma TaxID=1157962 RepID=A0A250XAB6_9CHLO|nr:hypothetical protein CEUSTIGMA_g7456.t1 [Chlamydomonas eustigma]|eukprot:GAX80017.1 hypothetical protein CEUSTIGMA_g7456.t1 [Chlamydomonas eustigma]
MIICTALTLLFSLTALLISSNAWKQYQQLQLATKEIQAGSTNIPYFRPTSRIAFGSCTSYDLRPQPVWGSVVAAGPDAWIWLGDMAYTDNPLVDCVQVPDSPQCNCTPNFLRLNPHQCFAGDMDHIRERFISQVNLPEYQSFLQYMCPGSNTSAQVPVPGSDPDYCPRPVLGTYDDHDSGWNNGNDRLVGDHDNGWNNGNGRLVGDHGSGLNSDDDRLVGDHDSGWNNGNGRLVGDHDNGWNNGNDRLVGDHDNGWNNGNGRLVGDHGSGLNSDDDRLVGDHDSGWNNGNGRLVGDHGSGLNSDDDRLVGDHDSGWNNGNDRLPGKHIVKNMFLDAIGEPRDSPRRTYTSGLQTSYTLHGPPGDNDANAAQDPSSREVQVVLLDERYYRDPLPCSVRKAWCNRVLSSDSSDPDSLAWCKDFVLNDGSFGVGSCCPRDDLLMQWCSQPGVNSSHPLWSNACDPTSLSYGLTPVAMNAETGALNVVDNEMYAKQQAQLWPWLVKASPICDVLGVTQRRWLQQELASSSAPLRIIASGSVPFGSIGFSGSQGSCSGDDWECWRPAQVNFLHTLAASVTKGCVLILTGDYHYADIKVVLPGSSSLYSSHLQTGSMKKPVWQFMSSGMTSSTAQGSTTCKGTYFEDLMGLRPLGTCSYFSKPNFGVVDIDWDARKVILRIADAKSGETAVSTDRIQQQVSFSLDTCLRV